MSRFASILLASLLAVFPAFVGSHAHGQQSQDQSDDPVAESDQQRLTGPGRGVSLTVAPISLGRYVPGRWSTLAVNAANRTDQDVVETATVIIGDQNQLQYARRLWIPSGARRQAWLPVEIPEDTDPSAIQIPMTTIHLQQVDGVEQFEANVVGMPMSKRSLLISRETSRTAAMIDPFDRRAVSEEDLESLSDMIYAGYDSAILDTQELGMVRMGRSFIPPNGKSLDPIDQIVVASDRVLGDTVGVNLLRGWLQAGGRIWVMVDKVSPESVRALLGDAMQYSIVDTVELNDFEIEQVPLRVTDDPILEKWSSETPVELVRVMVDTDDVHSRIDGWPTAFWQPVGRGEVLFTTLGSAGWLQDQKPTLAYKTLASRFFVNRIEPPQNASQLVSFLDEDIGYSIPSRWSVAGVLLLHMLIVLVAGVWLASRRQLQHLALIVPAAALAAAFTLVTIGKRQTSAVPSTIATGEIVRVIPASSQAQVESVSAVYSQETRNLNIRASHNTTTHLSESDVSGEVRRLQWDDTGEAQWQFVKQPPGVVRHVESESVVTMPKPWSVRARFDQDGLQGSLAGIDTSSIEDAVLVAVAAPSASTTFSGGASNAFRSGLQDILSRDQFIDAKFMSDVQQDRQDLLRKLISPDSSLITHEPSLLFWTDPLNAGVNFDDDYVRRGSTLASVPIRLERVASGSDFTVPPSFVRIKARVGERGISTIFNAQTGRWAEAFNKANETELQCLVPKVLLPCRLNRATVTIKISAPSRIMEIKGLIDGQFQTLHRMDNPAGILDFAIDNPDALQLDDDGGLAVAIAVSESESERQAAAEGRTIDQGVSPNRSTWQIDYVYVSVEGTTL